MYDVTLKQILAIAIRISSIGPMLPRPLPATHEISMFSPQIACSIKYSRRTNNVLTAPRVLVVESPHSFTVFPMEVEKA